MTTRGTMARAAVLAGLVAGCSSANPAFNDATEGALATGDGSATGLDAAGDGGDGGSDGGGDGGSGDGTDGSSGGEPLPECSLGNVSSAPVMIDFGVAANGFPDVCGQELILPGSLAQEVAGQYTFFFDPSGACGGDIGTAITFWPKGPNFPTERHCAVLETQFTPADQGCEMLQFSLSDGNQRVFYVASRRPGGNTGTPLQVGFVDQEVCECVADPDQNSCCNPPPGIYRMKFESGNDAKELQVGETQNVDANGVGYEVYNGESHVEVGCSSPVHASWYIRTAY